MVDQDQLEQIAFRIQTYGFRRAGTAYFDRTRLNDIAFTILGRVPTYREFVTKLVPTAPVFRDPTQQRIKYVWDLRGLFELLGNVDGELGSSLSRTSTEALLGTLGEAFSSMLPLEPASRCAVDAAQEEEDKAKQVLLKKRAAALGQPVGVVELIDIVGEKDAFIEKLLNELRQSTWRGARWRREAADERSEREAREEQDEKNKLRGERYLTATGEHTVATGRNAGHASLVATVAMLGDRLLSETGTPIGKGAVRRAEEWLAGAISLRERDFFMQEMEAIAELFPELAPGSWPRLVWAVSAFKSDATNSELVGGLKALVSRLLFLTCTGQKMEFQCDLVPLQAGIWQECFYAWKKQLDSLGCLAWDEAVGQRAPLPNSEDLLDLHLFWLGTDMGGDMTASGVKVTQEAAAGPAGGGALKLVEQKAPPSPHHGTFQRRGQRGRFGPGQVTRPAPAASDVAADKEVAGQANDAERGPSAASSSSSAAPASDVAADQAVPDQANDAEVGVDAPMEEEEVEDAGNPVREDAVPRDNSSNSPPRRARRPGVRKTAFQKTRSVTVGFHIVCKKHQVALVAKKESLKCCKEHVGSFQRACNVWRLHSRKMKKAAATLPGVDDAQRAQLERVVARAMCKPMKGRWGSFGPGRRKCIRVSEVAGSRGERFLLARIFVRAMGGLLDEAYEKAEEDEEGKTAIQDEEEEFRRSLRIRARYVVEDIETDRWWAQMICNENGAAECDHALNYLQARVHQDGTEINHCRGLARGTWKIFGDRTLVGMNFQNSVWRPLDQFLDNPEGVTRAEAFSMIVNHHVLVAAEFARRFKEFGEWPFYMAHYLDCAEDFTEPSEARCAVAQAMLGACKGCMPQGCMVLIEALTPLLEECVRSGGIVDVELYKCLADFIDACPLDTQSIEGENSILKHMQHLARRMLFGLSSMRMQIKRSAPLSREDYETLRPRLASAFRRKSPPFVADRYKPPKVTLPVHRDDPHVCPLHSVRSDCFKEAVAIASSWEAKVDLGDVIRLGNNFYLNCGKHFEKSSIGYLSVVDPAPGEATAAAPAAAGEAAAAAAPAAAAAGEHEDANVVVWPTLEIPVSTTGLFGAPEAGEVPREPPWSPPKLEDAVEQAMLTLAGDETCDAEVGKVGWDLMVSPPRSVSVIQRTPLGVLDLVKAGDEARKHLAKVAADKARAARARRAAAKAKAKRAREKSGAGRSRAKRAPQKAGGKEEDGGAPEQEDGPAAAAEPAQGAEGSEDEGPEDDEMPQPSSDLPRHDADEFAAADDPYEKGELHRPTVAARRKARAARASQKKGSKKKSSQTGKRKRGGEGPNPKKVRRITKKKQGAEKESEKEDEVGVEVDETTAGVAEMFNEPAPVGIFGDPLPQVREKESEKEDEDEEEGSDEEVPPEDEQLRDLAIQMYLADMLKEDPEPFEGLELEDMFENAEVFFEDDLDSDGRLVYLARAKAKQAEEEKNLVAAGLAIGPVEVRGVATGSSASSSSSSAAPSHASVETPAGSSSASSSSSTGSPGAGIGPGVAAGSSATSCGILDLRIGARPPPKTRVVAGKQSASSSGSGAASSRQGLASRSSSASSSASAAPGAAAAVVAAAPGAAAAAAGVAAESFEVRAGIDPHDPQSRPNLPLPIKCHGGRVYWSRSDWKYVAEHTSTKGAGFSRSIVPRVCGPGCWDSFSVANKANEGHHRVCYLEHVYCKESLIAALEKKNTTNEWGPLRHRGG
jgi:hypothetical protein